MSAPAPDASRRSATVSDRDRATATATAPRRRSARSRHGAPAGSGGTDTSGASGRDEPSHGHPAKTAGAEVADSRVDPLVRNALRSESIAVRVALAPIRLYQRVISPALPRRCKYHPTCSAYAVQAIRSYGILRGAVLAAWRLLRCNPFSHGGYDPVTAQTLFRRPPRSHSASASDS